LALNYLLTWIFLYGTAHAAPINLSFCSTVNHPANLQVRHRKQQARRPPAKKSNYLLSLAFLNVFPANEKMNNHSFTTD